MSLEPENSALAAQDDLSAPHKAAKWLSKGRWRNWRHLALISRRVAHCVSTPGGRLVVNVGPRWGKSELISHYTPVWFLANNPARRVLLATASGLARHYGGMVRDTIREHPELGITLKEDTTAKNEWATPQGGGMKAVTVGESVMGRGGDLLIVDDPYGSWADAWSAAYRKTTEEWFTATANSRLEPGASVVILHHRMHPKDLTNYVLTGPDGSRWEHLSLPSLAVSDADPLGRKVGESLCRARFSEEELERKRIAARWSWEPMHQQNPEQVAGGALYHRFTTANVRHDIELRQDLPIHIALDWNINPGMHAYVGQHDPRTDTFYCLHEIHAPRMSIDAAARELLVMYRGWHWKPELHIFADATGVSIKDGKSYGTAFRQHLTAAGVRHRDRIPGKNPGVIESVLSLNDALSDAVTGEVRYYVHPRCERLIRDFREVMPDEDGKPDKDADSDLTHASDTQRYWVHYLRPLRTVPRQAMSETRGSGLSGFVFGPTRM